MTLKSQGLHEHSWNYLNILLLEFLGNSKSDEKVILDKLKDINKKFSPTFISILRNKINYQGFIGIAEIKNNINFLINDDQDKFIKKLLTNSLEDSLVNKMSLSSLYTHYFFLLVLKLYSELLVRGGKNHIEVIRQDYLKKCKVTLPDLK